MIVEGIFKLAPKEASNNYNRRSYVFRSPSSDLPSSIAYVANITGQNKGCSEGIISAQWGLFSEKNYVLWGNTIVHEEDTIS